MKNKKEGESIPEENEDIPDLVEDTNFEEVSKKVDWWLSFIKSNYYESNITNIQ